MFDTFQKTITFTIITCCREGCGVQFGVTTGFEDRHRQTHNVFYCPNGHSQYFPGETEAEKLKRELEQKERQLKWANEYKDEYREQRDKLTRKLTTTKGHITRIKNRVGNGVCPCCKRTFKQLKQHMAHKHPNYKKETA